MWVASLNFCLWICCETCMFIEVCVDIVHVRLVKTDGAVDRALDRADERART